MKKIALKDFPRWSLYKKIRRTIQRELVAQGLAATESAVDAYLREHKSEVFTHMDDALAADLAQRAPREASQPRG